MYVLRVYADRVFTEAYGLVMRDAIPKFIDIIQFAKYISIIQFMTLSGFWLIGKYPHQFSTRQAILDVRKHMLTYSENM